MSERTKKPLSRHSLRRSLIIGSLLLILVPMLVLGTLSGVVIGRIVGEQSEQAHRQTMRQIVSNIAAQSNRVESAVETARTSERLCYILRHFIHDQVSLGREYDYYKEIKQLKTDLLVRSGAVRVRFAVRGQATYIKSYFDTFPEQILRDEFPEGTVPVGWLSPGTLSERVVQSQENLVYCVEMSDFMGTNEHQGYILIEMKLPDVFSAVNGDWEEGVCALVHRNGQTIYSGGNHQSLEDAARLLEGSEPENKYQMIRGRMDRQNWDVLMLVPLERILAGAARIRKEIFASALVISGIAILFVLIYTGRMNRRLNEILYAIRRMDAGEYGFRMEMEGNDEYSVIQDALNQMSTRTKNLLDDLKCAQEQQKEAEMRALYEQINPHFIYNTLDIIRWQALSGDTAAQGELAEALTSYLRLSLNHGREETTVGNEMEEIAQYMQIMNYRYREAIDFHTEIEPGLETRPVIKMILQPIVENAVLHGVMSRDDKRGSIRVRASSEGEWLVYRVEDDGAGMPQEKADSLLLQKDEDHYGLFNINARLRTYYGPECSLNIRSELGKGCTVTIRIPPKRKP